MGKVNKFVACCFLITMFLSIPSYAKGQVNESDIKMMGTDVIGTPTNLRLQKKSDGTVILAWSQVKDVSGYVVYRSRYADKGFSKVVITKQTSYKDVHAWNFGSYYYRVVAVVKTDNGYLKGRSSRAAGLMVRPGATQLWGDGYKNKATLRWKRVEGAQSYIIYRRERSGNYKKIAETAALSYIDTSVKNDETYLYRVAASFRWNGDLISGEYSDSCKIKIMPVNPNEKMIALTFDDGPGPYTQDILNCLRSHNAKATFFVVGDRVALYPEVARSIVSNGCEIGNHTLNHYDLPGLPLNHMRYQIEKNNEIVYDITGKRPTLLRPPSGSISATVRMKSQMPIILWSLDPQDWIYRDKNRTISYVMNQVEDGDIVLMHDIQGSTRDAILELVGKLQAEGYQLVTVSELAKYRGGRLKNGFVYSKFPLSWSVEIDRRNVSSSK